MSAMIAAAFVAAAAAVYTADQNRKAQHAGQDQVREQAKKAEIQSDIETNRVNAKKPNVGQMLAANQMSSMAGNAGTMLTGYQGIDPSQLQLGKNTLLGG